MRIDLNNDLKIIPPYKPVTKEYLVWKNSDSTYAGYDRETMLPTYNQTLFHIYDNIFEGHHHLHKNYLEYLELCWASHYGVYLSPDIIWYTLLCEIAGLVAENPDKYRHLFTNSPEQKNILVLGDEILPLEKINKHLQELVPKGFASVFTDDFSGTLSRARNAKLAAFADIVSPYYSYSMFMCGISSVELDGTKDDWKNLYERFSTIRYDMHISDEYFSNVKYVLTNIIDSFSAKHDDFWRDVFRAERCGSGGETELTGWFTQLFRNQPKEIRKACNFSSHISKVNYNNIDTKRDFCMKQGLFHSCIVDNTLVPDFSMIVYERKETLLCH